MKISKNDLMYALKKIAAAVNKENELLLEAGKKSVTLSVFDKETIQMQAAVPAEVSAEECGKRFVTLFSKLSDVVNVWRSESLNLAANGNSLVVSEGKVSVTLPFKEDMAELSLEGLVPGTPATIKQSELAKGLKSLLPLVSDKFPGVYLEPVEAELKPIAEEEKKASKKKTEKTSAKEAEAVDDASESIEEESDEDPDDSEGFDSEGFDSEEECEDSSEGFSEDAPSVEENEPAYNATRLWATDGARVARFTVAGTLSEPVYLPKIFVKVVASLKGDLTLIIMGGKYLLIKDTDNTIALVSIIAKPFPAGKLGEMIASFSKDAVASIEVAKSDFVSSLSLIQTVSIDEAKKFSFLFKQGDEMMLDLKEDAGKVTECLVGSISSECEFAPKFSAEYIRGMIEAAPTDKVTVKFTPMQALLMDDDNIIYVVCGFNDAKAKAKAKK